MSGHSRWSEVAREVTPERRARIDELKRQMAEEEVRLLTPTLRRLGAQLVRELFRR